MTFICPQIPLMAAPTSKHLNKAAVGALALTEDEYQDYVERAAILEFLAEMPREQAEAYRMVVEGRE